MDWQKLDEEIAKRALEYYHPLYAKLADFIVLYLALLILFIKPFILALIIYALAFAIWSINERIVKFIFKRSRPLPLYQSTVEDSISPYSFPSTHSLVAMFLATNISPAFIPIALTVAALRVVSLRHWFSDVVVGLAIGLLIGLVI